MGWIPLRKDANTLPDCFAAWWFAHMDHHMYRYVVYQTNPLLLLVGIRVTCTNAQHANASPCAPLNFSQPSHYLPQTAYVRSCSLYYSRSERTH